MKKHFLMTILLFCTLIAGCHDNSQQARMEFENPGGMWMPQQINDQLDMLRSLGVNNPKSLTNPLVHPLGAIVGMGCSASFVSDNGLIVTNHHCVYRSLQTHSSPECNIYENGFLARNISEELPAETGKKVSVTKEIIDVTSIVRKNIAKIKDPLSRYKAIEDRIKALIAEHEAPSKGIRCSVKEFFEGQSYYLIKKLELKDIRLVYAPPLAIGCYGGDIDNWNWPRHTGDVAFYRAYVAPDGSVAEYSPDNVPYKPMHYLRIATEPLKENDFVMVAGYPGRTQRWWTAEQVEFAYWENNPNRIKILTEKEAIFKKLAKQSDELGIKVTPSIKGVLNSLKYLQSLQENFKSYGLLNKKVTQQQKLVAWVNEDMSRKTKWGDVLDEIAALQHQRQRTAYSNSLITGLRRSVTVINSAHTIVCMARQRPKPDNERDPSYQQRNWIRSIQSLQQAQTSYDPKIDKAILSYYLQKIAELPSDQGTPILNLFSEKLANDTTKIDSFVNSLFNEKLTVNNTNIRVELFKNADTKQLRQSTDPAIQLALRIRPLTKSLEDENKIHQGKMALLKPKYMQAMQAFYATPIAPDANGSLRVTYGTVKGYRPTPNAKKYRPFTTLSGVLRKNTGIKPFNAPKELVEAAKTTGPDSPFYYDQLGDIPVNFLSDVDTTGGNSGSATLNRKGELVGLLFDGNSESLASDMIFMPKITRSIHADIRYILWFMKNVDHADNLLNEMNVK
ncbi:MAG: S46 family peptidase [Phycisphaerae bacterium]|nr:S46 family peptidase [Phycisphaerae bacterium]